MVDHEMQQLAMRRREDDEKLLTGLSKMSQRVDMLEATLESRLHLSIEEATAKSVKMVFSNLGVDVDSPTDLQRFRDDLRFGGVFRCAVERGFYAIITAICGAVAVAIWVVLQERIGLK